MISTQCNWLNTFSHQEFCANSCCCCLVAKSCPILCDTMDYNPPGFSVHRISQARILEWVSTPYSMGSSRPRDQTYVSCIGRQILYHLSHSGSLLLHKSTPLRVSLSLFLIFFFFNTSCVCLVAKSCLTPLWPQLSRFLCPWDFLSKNTTVGCHFLPQVFLSWPYCNKERKQENLKNETMFINYFKVFNY